MSEAEGDRGRPMSRADYKLSMTVSRRPRTPRPDEDQLRTLLVHRLTNTKKAVGRVSLRDGAIGIYCENCRHWTRIDEFPVDFDCACGSKYRMELAVYEEVE
jgi:hypothetical protein